MNEKPAAPGTTPEQCWTCRWFGSLTNDRFDHGLCHIPADRLPVFVRPQVERFVYRTDCCAMWEKMPDA